MDLSKTLRDLRISHGLSQVELVVAKHDIFVTLQQRLQSRKVAKPLFLCLSSFLLKPKE